MGAKGWCLRYREPDADIPRSAAAKRSSPRAAPVLRAARKCVERLVREAHISGLAARKRGRTTIRVPGVRAADDPVERRFGPRASNVLWIADLTHLPTWEGWL